MSSSNSLTRTRQNSTAPAYQQDPRQCSLGQAELYEEVHLPLQEEEEDSLPDHQEEHLLPHQGRFRHHHRRPQT